jgi:cytochrome P450
MVAPGPAGSVVQEVRRDPLGLFLHAADRYGGVVRLQLGPRPAHCVAYLVRDPTLIHQVLIERRQNYGKGASFEPIRMVVGDGLATSEGGIWQRDRRMIQPLFHRQRLDTFIPLMVRACERVIPRWRDAARRRETLDLAGEMRRLTLDVVGGALFGSDLAEEADELRPAFEFLIDETVRRVNYPLAGALAVFAPWLPTPSQVRVRRARTTIDAVVARLIARRRRQSVDDDLLAMLLAASDEETGAGLSDTEVRDQAWTFLAAGHDTTANTLSFTWYLLANHPSVADKLREELDSVLDGSAPTPERLDRLIYTKAVLQEAMRLYPPAWAFVRDVMQDDELAGYRIPARSVVVISPYACHRNPAIWKDPARFEPERFLGDSPAQHRSFAYLPFGAGPRQCIGAGFAMREALVVLAALASRFELDLAPGHNVQLEPSATLRPLGGLPMLVRRSPVS